MNLYKTISTKPEDGSTDISWTGSQADASKDRVRLRKEGNKDIVTTDVEVPTNKPGLLAYLNELTKS